MAFREQVTTVQRLPCAAEAHRNGIDTVGSQGGLQSNLYRQIRDWKSGHFSRWMADRHPSFPSLRGSEDPVKLPQPCIPQKCKDSCLLYPGTKFQAICYPSVTDLLPLRPLREPADISYPMVWSYELPSGGQAWLSSVRKQDLNPVYLTKTCVRCTCFPRSNNESESSSFLWHPQAALPI